MKFQTGYIYHIYNQGNNKEKIFLNRENYLFFLKKINEYVLPYCDILAWCLMPNHFHIMALVKSLLIEVVKVETDIHRVTQSHPVNNKGRTINDSIAIMLRSYTRAFNKMHGKSGALFRENTKAECVNCPDGLTPTFFIINGITNINIRYPELQYPQLCFDYIHQNPVKAKLVNEPGEWEFSSARDYAGLRNGRLVNKNTAREFVKFNL